MSIFSANLREMRFAAKLTQEELAKKIGVSRSTINEWEAARAQPNLETLKIIRDILKTTYENLLD